MRTAVLTVSTPISRRTLVDEVGPSLASAAERAGLEVTAGRLEALHREVGVLCGPWLVEGEPGKG